MATVQKVIALNTNADRVWKKISDVGAISKLIGFIAESHADGEHRTCKMADGGVLKERIIGVNDALMRVAYTITESPLGLEFHAASMQVVPNGAGSTFIWTTDLKPDAAAKQLDASFEEALPGMKAALETD